MKNVHCKHSRWAPWSRAALTATVAALAFAAPSHGQRVPYPSSEVKGGFAYSELEFDNPLAGDETVGCREVLEWRDAGFSGGSYEDWSVGGGGSIDGYSNEIWLRQAGQFAKTTTTEASRAVSVHLHGDSNDGLAGVFVNGRLYAKVDMYRSGTDNVQVLVYGLRFDTHTIEVQNLGQGPSGPGDDIALMGAAALSTPEAASQETGGFAYSELEFDNPLDGTEMIGARAVLNWRDAGFVGGGYEDWTVGGGSIDGYHNEIWLRSAGHWASTRTKRRSKAVSVHLHGDYNDGLARIFVDGTPFATVDMYRSGTDNVQVLVFNLPLERHTIRVVAMGSGSGPGDDIAIMGAAALGPDEAMPASGAGGPGAVVIRRGVGTVPQSVSTFPRGNRPFVGNDSFAVKLDDPGSASGIAVGARTYLLVGRDPASLLREGFGAVSGTSGEFLVDPFHRSSVRILGPVAWLGPRLGAVHELPVPANEDLAGERLFAQGVLVRPGGLPALTGVLELTVAAR